jgi:hypothetical protein
MGTADDIREVIWNEEFANPERLLEQYKMCVEMADRISQRRGAANTFFLTFNTAVVGALSGFYDNVPGDVAVAMYAAAAVLSIAWGLLLRSYRNLNSAKFEVIGVLEERLPANVYYKAEWKALGEGKDWRKYIPLSAIETFVPAIFFVIYLYLFAMSWLP